MQPYISGTQCTAILKNKMQCINTAVTEKKNDTEHKTSLCPVHVGPIRVADDYHSDEWVDLPRPSDVDPTRKVEGQSQTGDNTLNNEHLNNEKI